MKVAAGANGEWAKFKEEMQRRFKLGDGLLTKEDLEMLRRDEFSTVGAFATTFEKMAKKVPGLAEEDQCVTFLGHFKNWEGLSLTKKAAPGKKLTWAAIKEGVMDGELDQVDIFQMRQARKKRKALDATTSDGRDFKKMIEDAVAQLDAEKEAKRKTMAAPHTVRKAKKAVVQEEEEEEEEEQPEPEKLTKAQRKARNLAQGGQGSGRGQVPQAVAMPPPESSHQAAPAPYGPWPGCGPPRLISTNYDGDMYNKYGYYIDPKTPGGTRKEALRRAAAGPPQAPPTMFRIWQEKEAEPDVRVEEIGENEEVEQVRKAGIIREEPIIIDSDDEKSPAVEGGWWSEARRTMENMEDLLGKVRRYQGKLVELCEEVKAWQGQRPQVFLYGSGSQGAPANIPNVSITGGTPRSGISFRPPSRSGRVAQAVRTRAKGPVGSGQPAKDAPGPSGEKEVVELPRNEDEEDDRLRNEEDEKAEQRAKKRGIGTYTEKVTEPKKKYTVKVEEGFDVEDIMDRIVEGHNHLMNLKDVLASTPRLRDELKARLSRKMVASVHLGAIIPKEAEWAETGTKMDWKSVACGCFDVVMKGKSCTAMIDAGAEMNLIKEKDALCLGMEIDCSDNGILVGANSRSIFVGTASKVVLEIGKVKEGPAEWWGSNLRSQLSLFRGGFKQGSQRRYKKVDQKCRPVPVLVAEEKEVYYERERELIRQMRENAESMPCRINLETEKALIIGESGFLTAQEEKLMVDTIRGRHTAYAFNDDERGRLDVDKIPMIRIHIVPHEPWNLRGARYLNPADEEKVVNYLDGKIRTYVSDYSSGPYASPWFCFIKSNRTLRWVQDLQRLNAVTVRDAGGLPNADALSEACAGRAIISPIDLYSGYDQFPVYPSDRPMTTMHTPRGLIHMNVAPQGWTNEVVMVQRHMVRAMQPVSPHITQPYIDDLAVKWSKKKDEREVMPGIRQFVWDHVQDLCQVLDLLKEHNLTASGSKSKHCMSGATILGFVCDERGRRPDTKKTNKIFEWPTPFETITEVRSFLGTCGFWRIFIKGFAAKTEHLRKLVRQGRDWEWGETQEVVIRDLKKEFEEGGLVLGVPDHAAVMTRPFIVETDAGSTALGGVLIKKDLNGEERPLRFESRTLNTAERNYSQFKRETLAILHCLRIFRNYLFGSRFVLRVDPTALAGSLKNYAPSNPTIARWLTYIWMFDFELERILGNKNRADGLSRVDWDKSSGGVIEDTPPVDGFLDNEEDVRLHINSWSLSVGNYITHGRPVWLTPPGYVRLPGLVLKPYVEEDSWGKPDVEWMMELALADKHQLGEDLITVENGAQQVEKHERSVGEVYLLANALLQEEAAINAGQDQERSESEVYEREEEDFEEGEIKEAFRAEEYDGVYLELGMLLSCEMTERDASGHRSTDTTYLKIAELYFWHGMGKMIDDYCKSCVPCQERSSLRPREPLHPRYVREVGAVVHLDLLAMPQGIGGFNFIFDTRDNFSGFVDGSVIRTRTGETLARCIEKYYLRYPFVSRFVMDRGSEFTCTEVKALLLRYGVIAEYTTAAHPQANAPVERGHSTISNLLAKWTSGRPNQWPNFLRVAFFVDNITVRRSNGYAPATLWYGRHATFPIESFLKTWRRQDLETELTFEELLDLRARQIGTIEDHIEGAANRLAGNRAQDKYRWDQMARVRKEPLKVGDTVLLYDSSLEKQWSRKLDKRWLGPYKIARVREYGAYQIEELNETAWRDWVSGSRLKMFVARDEEAWTEFERKMEGIHPSPVGRDGVPIRFDGTNLEEFLWAYDRFADEQNVEPKSRVRGFLQFVRRHIRLFVRSVVERALHWGDCKRYTAARQAEERKSMEKKRKEPEAEGKRNFERGASSRSQEGEKRREHASHKAERKEEQPSERAQRRRWSEVPEAPPQPVQRQGDQPIAEAGPEGRGSPRQEVDEDQAAREKELERHERAARDREIGAEIRRKNLEKLYKRMEQEERSVVVKDKKGKRDGGEVGLRGLALRGTMKEGFAAARASDQRVGERLTKVAQKAYGQRVECEQEIRELKANQERQERKLNALKMELEKAWAGNETIRQVNQTLNKVNEAQRAYQQAQQIFFQTKDREWEKRIKELETKLEQRAPTTLVDWTEVQGFEMKRPHAEEAFRSQKAKEKADLQEGEDIPLWGKEMLQPETVHTEEGASGEESDWPIPFIVAHQQACEGLGGAQQAKTVRDESMLPIAQEVIEGQLVQRNEGVLPTIQVVAEGQMVQGVEEETAQGAGQEICQESATPPSMPLVVGLEEALGSWATGSGSETRVGGPAMQEGDRAACPIPAEIPQQEVTSEVTAVPSSAPSQEEERGTQKKIGKCFYCTRGKHRANDCLKSLKDEADGLVTEDSPGVWRDRNGVRVPRARDGVRAQLYRQLQMDLSDQE
ncbi:hypothetical protein CBR_g49582 [Chara braunii]|uniref:Integrase catalytic domain-containing protein n=1 Tax=Chara braunii TaxID=69332 RepID=A0A388M5B7_CHABU|nr:hypothetical protein CBR_g49582 [Chara braunii]|eukprot:GBG89730.1 hypothetical protein CBR_g49582 [Chara braunii]